MTRDEAHKKYLSNKLSAQDDIALMIIDEIYDDLESRMCQNCKHLTPVGVCMNEKSFCFDMSMVDYEYIAHFSGISKDEFDNFGCNKFERISNERD